MSSKKVTLTSHIENIGNSIYSSRIITSIKAFSDFSDVVLPSENSLVLKNAIEQFDINKTMYEILHIAWYTADYYLILTQFDDTFYKVYYNYNNSNNSINYAFYEIY